MRPLLLLLLLLVLPACVGSAPAPRPAEAPRCDACGESAAGGKRWPDGRPACAPCVASAVLHPSQAARARTTARQALQELFRVEVGEVPVTMLDRPELMGLAGRDRHPDLRAFTEIEDVTHDQVVVPELRQFRIFLLRGLPEVEAVGVLAHELFHVWQVRQGGAIGATDAFREGAAQWVQLRVYRRLGAEAWAKRLRGDTDAVYGEGLRRFEGLVLSRGEAEALRLAGTALDFPAGF